jgi:flagellar export protein FliJ
MKRFSFPPGRVMEWRRTEARIEEAKLERLFGESRGIDARVAELNEERSEAERALIAAPASTGEELAAVSAFQRFSAAEEKRLAAKRAECAGRIAAQMQVVARKRRDVRLLEKLKERRLKMWRGEVNRENDALGEEAYLARWNRESRWPQMHAEERG